MKKYLWIGMVLMFMGAIASDNPFVLKENLRKIDQDQDILLSELKEMSKNKKELEVNTETDDSRASMQKEEERIQRIKEQQAAVEAERLKKEIKEEESTPAVEEVVVVEVEEVEVKVTEKEPIEPSDTTKKEKLEKEYSEIRKVRLEKEKIAEEKLQADEEKKLAEEKIEVEAYEAKRIEKKKNELKKQVQIEKAKESVDQVEKEQIPVKQTEEVVSNKMKDINLTREALDATEEADKAYQEAIAEVDQED